MSNQRIIKKYPNRRLYDTELSRYITLADIRELVMDAVPFRVIDAHSNDDITRSILLQIIIEQESGGEPLFTTEVLAQMIRFYGDTVQGMFTRYLEKSLSIFSEQQSRVAAQMKESMVSTPLDTMAEITQRNMEMWQEMQSNFFKATTGGFGGATGSEKPEEQKTEENEDKTNKS